MIFLSLLPVIQFFIVNFLNAYVLCIYKGIAHIALVVTLNVVEKKVLNRTL